MSENHSYEKMLTEIQNLRKAFTSEKISHESTLSQLEASHKLNNDLQDVIKNQAKTINESKKEIYQKTMKIQNCAEIYEQQIIGMKELIQTKDEQLKKMRASLCVTDYDMIRLRVLNEVQLVHREEVQSLQEQIKKIQTISNELKIQGNVYKEKYESTKVENEKLIFEYENQIEATEKKYNKELNRLFDELQREKSQKKHLERAIETLNKRYSTTVEKYEKDISYISQQSPNRERSYPESNTQRVTNKTKALEEQLASTKTEFKALKTKYQNEIDSLKTQIKSTERENFEKERIIQRLEINLSEKSEEIERVIRTHQRKLKQLKEIHEDEKEHLLKQLKKQKESKQEYQRQILKENQTYNLNKNIFEIKERNDMLKKENLQLRQELQKCKQIKKNSDRSKRTISLNQSLESVDKYKEKLNEANRKIVTLLREKAMLKQQLSKKQLC